VAPAAAGADRAHQRPAHPGGHRAPRGGAQDPGGLLGSDGGAALPGRLDPAATLVLDGDVAESAHRSSRVGRVTYYRATAPAVPSSGLEPVGQDPADVPDPGDARHHPHSHSA